MPAAHGVGVGSGEQPAERLEVDMPANLRTARRRSIENIVSVEMPLLFRKRPSLLLL